MRVLVCGSRYMKHKEDYEYVCKVLYDFCDKYHLADNEYKMPNGLTIVHGGCEGADDCVDQWAVVNWVPVEEYPADWDKHGRAAGPIRNKQMLDTGIDIVIAFPRGRAKGTKNMMELARTAGVEVIEA